MNFIEIAKKKNKIKSLKDLAKGDFENNYVLEVSVIYNDYKIGDIVFVQKYRYKNGLAGNNHMFLIVDKENQKEKILYYGMLISSKLEKLSFSTNKFIQKDDNNNLRKDSLVKTDVIYKIFTKNILLKIGNIDKTKVDIYKNYLINDI